MFAVQAGHQRFGFAVLFQCLFHRDGNLNCFLKCQQMASYSQSSTMPYHYDNPCYFQKHQHIIFHSPYQCLHQCCNLCRLPKCPQTNTRTFKPHILLEATVPFPIQFCSRCTGIIRHGFWQDATGPLPVSQFLTQFHSSTDAPDNIVQNQPRSYLVLADCVRFWLNRSSPEASQCANRFQHVYWGGFSVQYTTNKGRPTC